MLAATGVSVMQQRRTVDGAILHTENSQYCTFTAQMSAKDRPADPNTEHTLAKIRGVSSNPIARTRLIFFAVSQVGRFGRMRCVWGRLCGSVSSCSPGACDVSVPTRSPPRRAITDQPTGRYSRARQDSPAHPRARRARTRRRCRAAPRFRSRKTPRDCLFPVGGLGRPP